MDLTITTPDGRLLWLPEPDTWWSDHVPLQIMPRQSFPQRCCASHFIAWKRFRYILRENPQDASLVESVTITVRGALRKLTLSMRGPVPDMKCLNIRAARRRAERCVCRFVLRMDWAAYSRNAAVFRRPGNRLQRKQWHKLCVSLHPSASTTKFGVSSRPC